MGFDNLREESRKFFHRLMALRSGKSFENLQMKWRRNELGQGLVKSYFDHV